MYKNIFNYETNIKNLISDNGEEYISYGVDCFEIENGFKRLVLQIIDISPDLPKVQSFVDTLNNAKLSYIHLYDTVDDFICAVN